MLVSFSCSHLFLVLQTLKAVLENKQEINNITLKVDSLALKIDSLGTNKVQGNATQQVLFNIVLFIFIYSSDYK